MAGAFQNDAFQNDAFQTGTTVSGSLTADAVLRRVQTASFPADAVLRQAGSGSFTADAVIVSGAGAFFADAVIRRVASVSFTADAVLRQTFSVSFVADAVVRKAGTVQSLTADAIRRKTVSATFTGNAIVRKTITSKRTTATFTPTQDGYAIFSINPDYIPLTEGTASSRSEFQTPLRIGQQDDYLGGGQYAVFQSTLGFATATIPDDATIVSATLELDGTTNASSQDFIVEVYAFDYGSSGGESADWRTVAEINALTLLATFDSAGFTTGQNVFTNVAFPANVNKTGDTKIILVSSRNRTQSAPAIGADEYLTFQARFGAGNDPLLTVVYDVPLKFTVDAVLVGNTQFGSFTANAVLRKTRSASLTANAVLHRSNQTASFTASAWIYSPRADPTGPGEPGETPMVSILVTGVDITADVILSDATFTMLVNGAIGTFRFRVRDDGHTYDFTSGAEVTLDIDGHRKFGGFALQPKRMFAFAVEDTSVPSRPSRFFVLEGVDYNILMTKRVVYDHDDPADVELRRWPVGSDDDDVIRYIFGLTDLAADGVTLDGVTHVGSPNPDKPGVVASGGLRFVEAMREINRLISGVFYIDPFKVLNFVDVDTPNATFGMSDDPGGGEVGYRELEQVENGTGLVNDAMVWGAGQGSNRMVFSRVQDATSIADHRRWQFGEFTTSLFRQASVDMRADTIVNGTPQSKRGGKDDQESWAVVSFEPTFTVGQKVEIESAVFGKADVVPIRRMTITFPTKKRPKYQMVLSHEIDEPWNLFEFWFPKFAFDFPRFDFDIPEGEGGGEPDTPCTAVYDSWTDLGEWLWVDGHGDGLAAREGLSPGWGFSGGQFYFIAAADASGNDGVSMELDQGPGTLDLFEYMHGGAFVILGSYTNPATTHISGQTASVSFSISFDGGSAGGVSFSHALGFPGSPLLADRVSLADGNPANTQTQVGGATPGTHVFALYVYPGGARLVTDGADLSLVHSPAWDLSLTDTIAFSLGEFPAASSGMVAGGTWSFGTWTVNRLDGATAPWCPTPEPPDGETRAPLTGDGSTTVFLLPVPYVINSTRVFKDGYFQRPGIEYTESDPATGEITFTTAPAAGSSITVFYHAIVGEF